MTYKEKCEYLSRYIRAMREIEANLLEYERWTAIGTKVNQIYSQDPPNNQHDGSGRVEKAAIKMAEILSIIQSEIEQAVDIQSDIMRSIEKSSAKARQKELLKWRYVKNMTVSGIAAMLNKDVRTIRAAIRKAINALDI